MNNKIIALVISGMSFLGMHNAMAENTSSMRFTGAITVSGCDVDTGGFSNVNLPSVTQKDFSGVHSVAGEQTFSVKISGCPGTIKKASLRVRGTADSTDKTLLAVEAGEGLATGIAIQLLSGGAPLYINSGYSRLKSLKNGGATFDLTARYVAVSDNVVAGGVAASAQVDMFYI